jgi:hypothetical protein
MGSTGMNRPKGLTDREFFTKQLLADHHEMLACATKAGSGGWQRVFYAAVRDNRTGEVWALVTPFNRYRGYENIIFKGMDETQGPVEDEAPATVLDGLTPTDSEYANGWRQRCWANLEREANRIKPVRGDIVRFEHELHFSDGLVAKDFTYEERNTFISLAGSRVRISGWSRYPHRVEPVG